MRHTAMRTLVAVAAIIHFLFPITTYAQTNCDNGSLCVSQSWFDARITKISKRGNFLTIQIEYRNQKDSFAVDFANGFVSLVDRNGQEFRLEGDELQGFQLEWQNSKVLSFRFELDERFLSPFDLTISANEPHGSITFFDLQTAN